MKAAYFMKNGGPEVMQYGDVSDPVAVLVHETQAVAEMLGKTI